MKKRILITYASGLGSTIEVAQEIGVTLGNLGFSTDVKPILDHPQLDHYQAILVGSAVRYGNWLPEALEFIETNQQVLRKKTVAVFCVHISNQGDDAGSRKNRMSYLDPVRAMLSPREEAFFAGKFDRRGAVLLLPGWIAHLVPTMDRRNWKKIRAWAVSLQPLLQQA
ncbi:MAG: flavodoxin domain-containing protein [Anaerolineales bacterium]|nr:flavodoxin domain-containing protein [Anaerolineales bacterium]